jgi:predicted site-specific integrase-resolvase
MDNSQPMRYAIYARYSSDLQRASSIADQIRKCDEFGLGQGWTQEVVFVDEAISGASMERPGLQRMLTAAFSGRRPFDVILIDDTSRISRNLSDAVQLFEKLRFAGLRVIAVGQGIDTRNEQADVLVTVHGLVDSLYVKELAKRRIADWRVLSYAAFMPEDVATDIAMWRLKAEVYGSRSNLEKLRLYDGSLRCRRKGCLSRLLQPR